MKYIDQCKFIWGNLVPESGQADCLQGEMLRQIEKLRYEAQNNGNINWDNNFEFFCDFLTSSLCGADVLSDEEKINVTNVLKRMKSAGRFACRFQNGEVSDEEFEKEFRQGDGLACVDDELYDTVCDAIGAFYAKYPEPIHYEANRDIYR